MTVLAASRRLRERLRASGLLVAPGAYDGLGARLVEQAGFEAVYMTGAGTSTARGYPDFGLLTLTEMVENAGTMARAAGIPLIADADTGYGNELNTIRTVREYEARGVAAIHLEDQATPKRCGHLAGKELVSREAFVSKIRAAVEARDADGGLVIIARTDARAVEGLDEAVARARAALEAGADLAFVEAPESLEEAAAIPGRVGGPCLLNVVPGGKAPVLDLADAERMGYKVAILPGVLLQATIDAGDAALAAIRASRRVEPAKQAVQQIFRRFGATEWDDLRQRFGAGEAATR